MSFLMSTFTSSATSERFGKGNNSNWKAGGGGTGGRKKEKKRRGESQDSEDSFSTNMHQLKSYLFSES